MAAKCEATGKVCFETFTAARNRLLAIKLVRKRKYREKRRKHRKGKPIQKRDYHCPYCDNYHLTHLDHYPLHQKTPSINKVKQALIIAKR